MAWVYVRVAWIDDGRQAAGAGGCDAFSCWDACQARQGRLSWLDYDRSVIFSPLNQSAFFFVDADADGIRR